MDTNLSTGNVLPLSSLTVANATAALAQGVAALRAGQTVFDLRQVQTVDSAAVSVMLGWQRAAREAGVALELQNLPAMLKSLTKLYGVCELVSPGAAACTDAPASAPAVANSASNTAAPAKQAATGHPHHHHH